MAAVFKVHYPIMGICMPTVILWQWAQGLQGLKCATLIHDLQQNTVAKPEMRFIVMCFSMVGYGVQYDSSKSSPLILFSAHSLPFFFFLLSVSPFLPCRPADATVMWSTLRCNSHYSLVALLTPSLRRKWERVGSMAGVQREQRNTVGKERGVEGAPESSEVFLR